MGSVIIHIDDAQWGDADGVRLLDEIVERPAPPVLLILTHRDGETTDALRALGKSRFMTDADVYDVPVKALAPDEVKEIVHEMSGQHGMLDAAMIARESDGNPYFAAEIIRHTLEASVSGARSASPNATLTLGDMILSRYRNLPFGARRVLDAVSLYNAPMSLPVLAAANGDVDVDRAVAILRSASFARTHRSRDTTTVEPYHDRVREVIDRALSDAERRSLHGAIAWALEAAASDNWEQMLVHFEGAGELGKAVECALKSAERAFAAQAFEHAAALYRRTLQLGTWNASEQQKLTTRLGDALAMSGHGLEAAETYESAAANAPSRERIRLQMLAAGQLLCSGYTREGALRLTASVGYLGVSIPEPDEILPSAISCLQQALSAGPGLVYRDEASIDAEELLRIDACWWAAKGLFSTIPTACQFLTSFHLAEAVRAGEPMRIARGAYAVAAFTSAFAPDDVLATLMDMADAAAEHAPSPNTRFWREYTLAWHSHWAFDMDQTVSHIEAAYGHASAGGQGLEREIALLTLLEVANLYEGEGRFDIQVALRRHERWRRDAVRRGDRFLMAFARACDFRWWLEDAPEPQRRDLTELLSEVSRTSSEDEPMVWSVKTMLCCVERYMGMLTEALTRSEEVLRCLRSSRFWVIPRQRVSYGRQFVACAIAAARQTGNLEVLRDAETVLAQFPEPACGMVALFRAGIAHVRGDRDDALRLLEIAALEPGKVSPISVSVSARWFQGLLLGGSRGGALAEAAESDTRGVGIANPWRFTNAMWPGFGDHRGPCS